MSDELYLRRLKQAKADRAAAIVELALIVCALVAFGIVFWCRR